MTTAIPLQERSLSLFFEESFRPRRLSRAARVTIRIYHSALKLFSAFLGREATLADLSDEAIENFAWSRLAAGRALETARRYAESLLTIWRHACDRSVLSYWPATLRLPKHVIPIVNLRVFSGE